mmetsp:Transcript_32009/g.23659  ORF Transcript_32009/g.23659 Transcript_32009/m.23659 type:complete len:80 (+) Transcript_32009:782-1021(+)
MRKQNLLKGLPDLISYSKAEYKPSSFYKENFYSKIQRKDKIKLDYKTSCAIGGIIPDPITLNNSTSKHKLYLDELKSMT